MSDSQRNDDESNALELINPVFTPSSSSDESAAVKSIIKSLSLIEHVEGGYFAVTDVSNTTLPSPYPPTPLSQRTIDLVNGLPTDFDSSLRQLSTTIFYYLTPKRPQGSFHRNRSRIIHSLHRGRGRYVLIHPDGHIESFVVGHDVERGEKLQWVVEGHVWKASFLLADDDGQSSSDGLLISETVVPGFEYADHEFLSRERLVEILPGTKAEALEWLVKH
ncbi:RmlC-like cupin domain-containing protein [Trichoderma ceciliae]